MLLALLSFGTAVPLAQAQMGTITVSGQGVIKTQPDMATVWFGVVTHHDLPQRARELNADASADAMNAIRALGVEEEDLKVESLRLAPRREYDPERRTYNEIGFEATRGIVVEIKDLDVLPEIVATIVSNGANRINNIQYGLENKDDVELEALERAVARAQEKAAVMAARLGRAVGPVAQINEQGVTVPQPMLRMEAAMDVASSSKSGQPDAFAGGEIEVSASVTVVFAMVDKK